MQKAFEEWFEDTKLDHISDITNYLISPDIYGDMNVDEDKLKYYLKSIWEEFRQNMTWRDI